MSHASPAESEINLISALKTAFSENGDPEMYLARAADSIRLIENRITEICLKNRVRMDGNLYNLLESRDAIVEYRQELQQTTTTASATTQEVAKSITKLTEKMQIRKNLDSALAIAGQTRKLTRMYARIADTIDSRRLYAAFRMLKVLEDETRCVQPGTVLEDLVPDCQRLRAKITLHNRKAFHSWLSTVKKFEHELGTYALQNANNQMNGEQILLGEASLNNSVSMVPSGITQPADTPRYYMRRAWIPMLTSNPSAQAASSASKARLSGSFTMQRYGLHPTLKQIDGSWSDSTSTDARKSSPQKSNTNDQTNDAPKLFMRTLLQCILVNDGLGLLSDMRSDYRRERYGHLIRLLDEAETGVSEATNTEIQSKDEHQSTVSRILKAETVAMKVAGFFIVERAVEKHASIQQVPRAVVDSEWWPYAHARIQSLCRDGENDDDDDKQKLKQLDTHVEQFAKVYTFTV